MPRPAGLILDYGNVLSRAQEQTWMDGAARRLGGDAAAFRAAYWQHRHAYDSDLPAAAYWQRVVAAARPGALVSRDLAWLIASDVASWTVYHDEVWRSPPASVPGAGAPRSSPTAARKSWRACAPTTRWKRSSTRS